MARIGTHSPTDIIFLPNIFFRSNQIFDIISNTESAGTQEKEEISLSLDCSCDSKNFNKLDQTRERVLESIDMINIHINIDIL